LETTNDRDREGRDPPSMLRKEETLDSIA